MKDSNSLKTVTIYTDGSAKGNPGPGGYGAVLLYKNSRKEISKGFKHTTNNRMELMAVIAALKHLKYPCAATIYTDSRYIVDAINKNWIGRWKTNNWQRTKTEPVMNYDLWEQLYELLQKHKVIVEWVKGHNNNVENERCDLLAVTAAESSNQEEDLAYIENRQIKEIHKLI